MDLFTKLKKMKILLIDDDEWIRDSLSVFFESEGCQLQALETAEEALNALSGQTYNIIIADYRLPGMDGLAFFKHIQESQPEILKILITAYKTDAVVSEAMDLGVNDLIEKPFTTNSIEASLSRLVGTSLEKSKKGHLNNTI